MDVDSRKVVRGRIGLVRCVSGRMLGYPMNLKRRMLPRFLRIGGKWEGGWESGKGDRQPRCRTASSSRRRRKSPHHATAAQPQSYPPRRSSQRAHAHVSCFPSGISPSCPRQSAKQRALLGTNPKYNRRTSPPARSRSHRTLRDRCAGNRGSAPRGSARSSPR